MGGTVIEHLQKCGQVSTIIAVDRRAERVAELQEKYEIKATQNLDEVLDDEAIPLVFITASNDAHAELAIQSLRAGKAVMCEKPMATTLEEAREMVETAESLDGFLQIGFELRYSYLYSRVRDWIDQGLLGDVINTQCSYIASAWPKNSWRTRRSSGGSLFGEKLSHYVDLPRWWVGFDVTTVFATSAPNVIPYYEVHDNYHATYQFENGAVSHLTFMMAPAATFEGDPLQSVIDQQIGDGHTLRFRIVGTRGAAETDVFARSLKRWEFGDAPDKFTSSWVENITWDGSDDHFWFHNTLEQTHDIVRRVANGEPPRTPARDAFETMRLCFAAEEAVETGRSIMLAGGVEA